ncbi:MAG TPA: type IX secretion system membrane protein PorP/SprF [Phaeodactylibacter sp.]|nr:type IX secretion system membrane protein PorP/SprF [Phaeodactylibacter sp.]
MNSLSKRLTIKVIVFFLFFSIGKQINAQDIHFSQIGNSPLNISPALTAVFSGDVRFVGNYKSQWQSVPVSYLTFSGAYEMKFLHKKMPNSQFGGGLIFNYDRAGSADLSLAQLGLNIGYTHQLSERNFISAGFQVSANQRMFKPQQLSFDDQFDGESFRSDIASQEIFESPTFAYFNYSVGFNWHYQKPENRTRFDFGVSVFNLNEARQSFFNKKDINLSKRVNLHGLGSFKVGEKMDLMLLSLISMQKPYAETLLGFAAKFYLNQTMSKELAIQFGMNYRVADALIPTFEIDFRNTIRFGVSYDVNTSIFTSATNGKGSPEFSIIYTLNKIKPLGDKKLCPLY